MAALTLRAGDRARRAPAARTETRRDAFWVRPNRAARARDRILWLRQMALLLRAGVPLLVALDKAQPNGRGTPTAAWATLRADVEAGRGLAQAMERQPQLFEAYSVRMVACAEWTGTLDLALERLAAQHERHAAVRRTVRRALVYPSVVAAVACAAMAVLLIFVVPVFAEIFAEQGAALPWPTRVVLRLSHMATVGAPILVAVGLALAAMVAQLLRQPTWRAYAETLLLRVPLFGPIVRASATARAADSLANLLTGGVPLLDALGVAAETAGNAGIGDSLRGARREVSDGHSLSGALRQGAMWPDLALQLIAVGEATGALDTMLTRVGELLQEEGEQRVNLLLALLEPAIIVALAIAVGGLVLAMYLPVFRLGALL